jgi:hypothetical protein
MKRSGIKRKRPYVDPAEKKIRDSARNEECTLRFEFVCNGRTDTTVYCHSNLLEHGKGAGLKAKTGCYGCFNCHNVLDFRAPRPRSMSYDEMIEIFKRACEETQAKLVLKGLHHVAQDSGTGAS